LSHSSARNGADAFNTTLVDCRAGKSAYRLAGGDSHPSSTGDASAANKLAVETAFRQPLTFLPFS
jgi:hypothetical protein